MKYKIKSFEDACQVLGIDPAALPDVSAIPEKHRAAIIAHYKLVIIAEALNKDHEPTPYRYFPVFDTTDENGPSGFGFSNSFTDVWITDTFVGARLEYRTRELSDYAGRQFIDLYRSYFVQ